MSRRVSLPGAAELFRATDPERREAPAAPDSGPVAQEQPAPERTDTEQPAAPGARSRGSGRVRHDEKITVYVSTDELLALEQARLRLRAEHGTAVDRGRIVREAVALALAELDDLGPQSRLARRLTDT